MDPDLICDTDGLLRCQWALEDARMIAYHDSEWGCPVSDDTRLFEKMTLESFQAGLSWRTILNKREAFRTAFDGFDIERVASYTKADIDRLLTNKGIVRHRGKIESAIHNAGVATRLIAEYGSLAAFVWWYEPAPASRPARITWDVLQSLTRTEASAAMARDLKRKGWKFFGPVTAYAFMQSMGIVNDHQEGCFRRVDVEALRNRFPRPGHAHTT